jgi:hypothetical protein
LFSLIALLGCDARSVNKEAFNSAKPELQQIWQTALAANKASDYVRANTNLVSLLSREITPAQLVAVQDALASLNERMYTAAAKGDPAAQKSLEALKLSSPKPARAR